MQPSPIGILLYLALAVLWVLAWWNIFDKAGFSGALALLMLVPLVNLGMFLFFAFAEWPVRRELASTRSAGPTTSQ